MIGWSGSGEEEKRQGRKIWGWSLREATNLAEAAGATGGAAASRSIPLAKRRFAPMLPHLTEAAEGLTASKKQLTAMQFASRKHLILEKSSHSPAVGSTLRGYWSSLD